MKVFIFAMFSFLAANCQGQIASDTAKKQQLSQDTTFYPQEQVEITAEYPGGKGIWKRYLNLNMREGYISESSATKIKVTIQFAVDKKSHVSNVQAIDGPDDVGYRQEAVRLVKKSGLWVPAIRNGHQVNSYRKVIVEF